MRKWNIVETGHMKKSPQISISKGKSHYIRFNPAFIYDYNLGNKDYITILIDNENDELLLGFRFLDKKVKNSLKISRNKKTGTGYVSGGSLFKSLLSNGVNIENIKKTSFDPVIEEFEKDKIFVIKIKKE